MGSRFEATVDSYYEYMLKQHLLVGGVTDLYSKFYEAIIETAQKVLFYPLEIYSGRDYLVRMAGSFQETSS